MLQVVPCLFLQIIARFSLVRFRPILNEPPHINRCYYARILLSIVSQLGYLPMWFAEFMTEKHTAQKIKETGCDKISSSLKEGSTMTSGHKMRFLLKGSWTLAEIIHTMHTFNFPLFLFTRTAFCIYTVCLKWPAKKTCQLELAFDRDGDCWLRDHRLSETTCWLIFLLICDGLIFTRLTPLLSYESRT